MSGNLIASVKWRAQNPQTIHDMALGLSPTPKINPLISQIEIDEAENTLGFKLPVPLKDILTQIGNGGFGPGYGLYQLQTMVKIYFEYKNDNEMNWKNGLLPILTWGCTYESCIDCLSENNPVYFTERIEGSGSHCLDNVSYTITDKDGNLLGSGNTGDKNSQNSNSSIQVDIKPQKNNFEIFMNDWAHGIDLWEEIMGPDEDGGWDS